jgi:hypothetical protein
MAIALEGSIYAICPIDDCPVAFEADIDSHYLCPTCKIEMLTTCPQCGAHITSPEQVICGKCEGSLKE